MMKSQLITTALVSAAILGLWTAAAPAAPIVMDDVDATFSIDFWGNTNDGYDGNARWTFDSPATATYSFTDLAPGAYELFATWVSHPNRAPDVPFDVYDGTTTGTLLGTVDVNKENAPVADMTWKDSLF